MEEERNFRSSTQDLSQIHSSGFRTCSISNEKGSRGTLSRKKEKSFYFAKFGFTYFVLTLLLFKDLLLPFPPIHVRQGLDSIPLVLKVFVPRL